MKKEDSENISTETRGKRTKRRRRKPGEKFRCHACKKELPFCWNCPCGFQICDDCLKENAWGITNGPTWVCPDCGRVRMF